MNTLGQRIRLARGSFNQDVFSAKISVSKGSLGGYERDENLPNTDVILKICSETGTSVEWLMTGNGPMRPGEAPQPAANAPEKPVIPAETLTCARCAKLEAKLEAVEQERRELSAELREVNAENRKLSRENGDLKARCATLTERQKTCCPEPLPLFKKTDEDQGAPNNVIACA